MGTDEGEGKRLARWAAIVTAVVVVLAVGGPLIGRGVFIAVDVINKFSPWNADAPTDYSYSHGTVNDTVNAGTPARVAIREGIVDDLRIPLWDPYPNGGTPLGSQPSTGLLSPLNWPELILGVKLGSAWAALLRFAVGAIGAYYLLRRLGVSKFAGACGGLIYCVNGYMIFWNNFPQADIAALLPALFLTADLLRERRRARELAFFAVVVAALLLEGYPPLVLSSMYALAPFLAVRWWESSFPRTDESLSFSARARRTGIRLREAVRPAALVIGAGVLGAAIAAFQLLPFLSRLGVYDTSYREVELRVGTDATSLFLMAVPLALGKLEVIGNQPLFNPFLGGRAFFLGAAAVVFALWALILGRPEKISRGIYRYCIIGASVLLIALVRLELEPTVGINEFAADALYLLPGMDQVPLSRVVALFTFFVTLIAAFGIEHVVASTRPNARIRVPGRWPIRIGIIGVLFAYCAWSIYRSEVDFFWLTGGWATVREASLWPGLLALAAVAVIVIAWRSRGRMRWVALAAIPLLLAVETLAVTTPSLPRAPNADYYPRTASIDYLARHLGHDRFAASESMLFQSTNTFYGLRSVSGHSFTPPSWYDLVTSTSPDTPQSPTHTVVGNTLDVATSPVFDQLSARYFVNAPEFRVFGQREEAPPATGTATLSRRASANGTIAAGPLRAVGLTITGPSTITGTLAYLNATVRSEDGTVIARGSRRISAAGSTATVFIPIAGERLTAASGPLRVEITLRSDAPDHVTFDTTPDGHAALSTIRPRDDGLVLAHADRGAVIYRRRAALPRIRWASRSEVVPSAEQRMARISGGTVDADTVILDQAGPAAGGKPAKVVVDEDSGDEIRATVHAEGAGYLVVADALQDGWRAELDGESVELDNANHAMVAIRVPAGSHTVTLSAAPRGWRLGIVISIAATILLIVLFAWPIIRRRTRSGSSPEVDGEHVATR